MPEETRSMIADLAGEDPEKETEQEQDREHEHPEPDADDAIIKDLIAELKKFDIVLPDDTNESNFFERLQVGLKTAAAHEGLDEAQDTTGAPDSQITVAENGGMSMMSLEVRTALDKASRQHAYAENQHRAATGAQLQSLLNTGRCTPHEFAVMQEQLPSVKLSLDSSGNPEPSDLDKWIASRKPLPTGTFWEAGERTVNMALEVEEHPEPMNGKESPEKVNAVLAAVFKTKQ